MGAVIAVRFPRRSDLSKYKIVATMRAPHVDLKSLYKVVGRVLLIPINGNGKTTIKMGAYPTSGVTSGVTSGHFLFCLAGAPSVV